MDEKTIALWFVCGVALLLIAAWLGSLLIDRHSAARGRVLKNLLDEKEGTE